MLIQLVALQFSSSGFRVKCLRCYCLSRVRYLGIVEIRVNRSLGGGSGGVVDILFYNVFCVLVHIPVVLFISILGQMFRA